MYVALTEHLIQSTMRCENCIDNVDIDSIECIRDPCLVSTVSTYIVLMVWLKSPESQLSKIFLRIENPLKIKKVMCRNVWMCFDSSIYSLNKHSIQCIACFDLCTNSVDKQDTKILCIDHLNMPFNVHTTDKVTMITVSGFLTI